MEFEVGNLWLERVQSSGRFAFEFTVEVDDFRGAIAEFGPVSIVVTEGELEVMSMKPRGGRKRGKILILPAVRYRVGKQLEEKVRRSRRLSGQRYDVVPE